MKINTENIQKRGDELGIPFRNLLAGVILEMTAGRLFGGSFSRSLCIINADDLDMNVYRKKPPLNLMLYYFLRSRCPEGVIAGRPVSAEVLGLLSSELFPAEDRDGIRWQVQLGEKEIYATALLDKYEIPLEISLQEVAETAFICVPREMRYTLDNVRSTLIMTYPMEMKIADNLADILDKLELLGDMAAYYDVYECIHRNALTGRKIQERLTERSAHFDRLELVQSYVNHKHMQKKWRSFLRARGMKEPAWEEALMAVSEFMSPICEASLRNDIFFDDWMPELGRFM